VVNTLSGLIHVKSATPGGKVELVSRGELCAKQSKCRDEISGIAAIDIDRQTDFHLDAVQTPNRKRTVENSTSLLDWYLKIISHRKDSFF